MAIFFSPSSPFLVKQEHGCERILLLLPRGPFVWESGEQWRGRFAQSGRAYGCVCVFPMLASIEDECYPKGMSVGDKEANSSLVGDSFVGAFLPSKSSNICY